MSSGRRRGDPSVNTVNGQCVIDVRPGHFVTTNGIQYAGTVSPDPRGRAHRRLSRFQQHPDESPSTTLNAGRDDADPLRERLQRQRGPPPRLHAPPPDVGRNGRRLPAGRVPAARPRRSRREQLPDPRQRDPLCGRREAPERRGAHGDAGTGARRGPPRLERRRARLHRLSLDRSARAADRCSRLGATNTSEWTDVPPPPDRLYRSAVRETQPLASHAACSSRTRVQVRRNSWISFSKASRSGSDPDAIDHESFAHVFVRDRRTSPRYRRRSPSSCRRGQQGRLIK
jgi:hypothetical protein